MSKNVMGNERESISVQIKVYLLNLYQIYTVIQSSRSHIIWLDLLCFSPGTPVFTHYTTAMAKTNNHEI